MAELTNESGEANTAAENDGFFLESYTLNTALSENPDVNFVISAGDQVNKTGEAKRRGIRLPIWVQTHWKAFR